MNMKGENILRIFVPHHMLIQPSGVIRGSWSGDKSIASVTCLERPSNLKNTFGTNLVTLGIWKNIYSDRVTYLNVSDEFDHFMDRSPTKWFLLEKQNTGLPVCTLSQGHPIFDSVIVVIYDSQKLQCSHYLTDSAHTNFMDNGLACQGTKSDTKTNLDQLTLMLMKHENIHHGGIAESTTCLTTGHNGTLDTLGSVIGSIFYCLLRGYSTVTNIVFDNR